MQRFVICAHLRGSRHRYKYDILTSAKSPSLAVSRGGESPSSTLPDEDSDYVSDFSSSYASSISSGDVHDVEAHDYTPPVPIDAVAGAVSACLYKFQEVRPSIVHVTLHTIKV